MTTTNLYGAPKYTFYIRALYVGWEASQAGRLVVVAVFDRKVLGDLVKQVLS